MKPVLIIDCYIDGDGTQNYRRLLPDRTLSVWRPVEQPRPENVRNFAAIMITGSAACVTDPAPWMESLASLIRDAHNCEVPILGICFGHQMIAYSLFGADAVRTSATPEIGWTDVCVLRPDPIFADLGSGFKTFESHFDEVVDQPGMTVLAESDRCQVQAYRVDGYPTWGVQFHAEMDQCEAEALTAVRIGGRPDLGFDLERKLAESKDSTKLAKHIMGNFLSVVHP